MAVELFDWFEYIVFGVMLLLSTTIGIFFCCYKGGQHTIADYYLGNKQMSVFPVAMSLIASFVSGVTLLGFPSEIYSHGAQMICGVLAELFIFYINITFFLPVFYNLQVISLYEYLEMRFDRKVRILASGLFATAWILYLPVVIYGPALAFNQVSGVSVHIVSPIVCLVCIFYTTVGGLKAVVWADALQGSVMFCTVFIILVTGLLQLGGIGNVISAAKEGDRLDIFNMDPDPTERLSFWSSTIGITFMWSYDLVSPMVAQRFVSLPSLKSAKKAAMIYCIGLCLIFLLSFSMGLIIYAKYRFCDPLSAGMIKRADQILPHFVLMVAGHLKGLPGLFVAGVVCAALSTLSTGMNTLSGTLYEDFLEPVIGKKSELTASNIMKVIAVLIGVTCTALVSVVEKLGSIVDIVASVDGVLGGAIFGIFAMGVLVPRINAKGAFYGGLLSSMVMLWIMVGHELAPKCYSKKPISIEGCSEFNITASIINETCPEVSTEFKTGFPFYKLTAFYFGFLGFSLCVLIAVLVSFFTGFNDPSKVKPELLSPFIRGNVTEKNTEYTPVELKKTDGIESS